MAAKRRFSGRDGFTLIEALAAFAILAMLTLVVQRAFIVATSGLARVDDRVAAEQVARTLLAEPLGRNALASGQRSGVADGHPFTVRFETLDLPAPAGPPEPKRDASPNSAAPERWRPVRVSIRVETARGRPLEIETVRLAQVDPR